MLLVAADPDLATFGSGLWVLLAGLELQLTLQLAVGFPARGIEGAGIGKPVVLFSRHLPITMLPHVQTVTDAADLPKILRAALSPNFDRAQAELAGQKLLQALTDASFDLGKFSFRDPGKVMIEPEWITAATAGLERSLVSAIDRSAAQQARVTAAE